MYILFLNEDYERLLEEAMSRTQNSASVSVQDELYASRKSYFDLYVDVILIENPWYYF